MIWPAIDIQQGRSVRLFQGDFKRETVINPDPVAQVQSYEEVGVKTLHLVDLDGAKAGKPINSDIVRRVRAIFTGRIEIGGGIRTASDVALYMDMGINRIILGSIALKNPELTKQLLAQYGGERIVIGVDGWHGCVATEGWLQQSNVPMDTLIQQMMAVGAQSFIVTDVSRDGAMEGPNKALLSSLQAQFPTATIIASGGIRHMEDIRRLHAVGVTSAVVGKALYDGGITLSDIASYNKEVKRC